MKVLAAAIIVLLAGSAAAQDHQHKHGQPYAGMQARPVKALSDQQIADLRAGRGMGLAQAAELNGYPGPLHVLELADRIGLSPDQRREVQRLYDAMKAEAIAAGERCVDCGGKAQEFCCKPAGSLGFPLDELRSAGLIHLKQSRPFAPAMPWRAYDPNLDIEMPNPS